MTQIDYFAHWYPEAHELHIFCLGHGNPWVNELLTKEAANDAAERHFVEHHDREQWQVCIKTAR